MIYRRFLSQEIARGLRAPAFFIECFVAIQRSMDGGHDATMHAHLDMKWDVFTFSNKRTGKGRCFRRILQGFVKLPRLVPLSV